MSTVGLVARLRLARHWPSIVAAGLLLGIGFGLSFACFATARSTVSSYDRILEAAEAPDAAVAIGLDPIKGEAELAKVPGITAQRVYAGFLGHADGLDPVLSTALIAPIRDRFPLETPRLVAGRPTNPNAPDEVWVNTLAANGGNLQVGQELRFHFVNPYTGATGDADVRITGIGTVPAESVADETGVLGVFVFTRAFFDKNRPLVSYAASNVDLAPGVDARRDLAPALGTTGFPLQSARDQEQHAVIEALRPFTIVVVALGVLAFVATSVGAAQVLQRNRVRWGAQSATLRTLGMTRGQVRDVELLTTAVIATITVSAALGTMLLASPVAPIGPLHDFDPARGFGIDWTVALTGIGAVVVTLFVLTLAWSSVRRVVVRPLASQATWLTSWPARASTIAGLALAVRADDGRRRARRAFGAPTAATVVFALCAAFVTSAVALTSTPSRYGFDADVLALNAYGDQDPAALKRVFADNPDVEAATGFTAGSFIVAKRAVPGLAMTEVKGELSPTILRGRSPQASDEIVLGEDTLAGIDAQVGDVVGVQMRTATFTADGPVQTTGKILPMRIVGSATFPTVNQVGTDMPRLGTGALVIRDVFLALEGDKNNQPEFTMARLRDGADPQELIRRNPEAFKDVAQSTTAWFTGAKAAELQQLDAALPYLRGALVIGYAILLAVMVHALWTRARTNRRPIAVLRAMGCTRSQLDATTAWQVAPYAIGAALIGLPLGILLGRGAYRFFAQSLAVVDTATTSLAMLAGLLAAVLLAAAIAGAVGIVVARRSSGAAALREG
jgi:putative ABC transport system permease protein